jgi:hypothetical protein
LAASFWLVVESTGKLLVECFVFRVLSTRFNGSCRQVRDGGGYNSGRTGRCEGESNSYLDALVSLTAVPVTGDFVRPFGAHFGAG